MGAGQSAATSADLWRTMTLKYVTNFDGRIAPGFLFIPDDSGLILRSCRHPVVRSFSRLGGGPFFKRSKKNGRRTVFYWYLFLLFFFQFSFFLWIKLSLFLLFPFAFVFFSFISHICFSLFESELCRTVAAKPHYGTWDKFNLNLSVPKKAEMLQFYVWPVLFRDYPTPLGGLSPGSSHIEGAG